MCQILSKCKIFNVENVFFSCNSLTRGDTINSFSQLMDLHKSSIAQRFLKFRDRHFSKFFQITIYKSQSGANISREYSTFYETPFSAGSLNPYK